MLPTPSPGAYGGQAPMAMGITWFLACITTLVVCARTYVTLRVLDRPGWDLYWAWIAYLTTFAAQILQTISAVYGIGNHKWFLTTVDLAVASKYSFMGRMTALAATVFGKNIVIALLLRVQGPTHKRKAWLLHFIWISNTVLAILTVVILCARCHPVAKTWNMVLPGKCINPGITKVIGTFQGSWMAASDFTLAIYPVFVFWNLNRTTLQKLGLCALMGGGVIAGACAVVKVIELSQAYETADIPYNLYPLLITTMVEAWMVIILASIPPLRVFFVKAVEKGRTMISHQSGSYGATIPTRRQRTGDSSVELTNMSIDLYDSNGGKRKPHSTVLQQPNESEEDILPREKCETTGRAEAAYDGDLRRTPPPGITVRTDYNVSYDDVGVARG